jgi:hypothetical protein
MTVTSVFVMRAQHVWRAFLLAALIALAPNLSMRAKFISIALRAMGFVFAMAARGFYLANRIHSLTWPFWSLSFHSFANITVTSVFVMRAQHVWRAFLLAALIAVAFDISMRAKFIWIALNANDLVFAMGAQVALSATIFYFLMRT